MLFRKGDKLDIITRHQDTKGFARISTIGEVVKASQDKPDRMKVRVFRPNWRPEKGYLHEFLGVSDTVWLERIGIRKNANGSTNLPHVHEIVGKLSEKEFEARHPALQSIKRTTKIAENAVPPPNCTDVYPRVAEHGFDPK